MGLLWGTQWLQWQVEVKEGKRQCAQVGVLSLGPGGEKLPRSLRKGSAHLRGHQSGLRHSSRILGEAPQPLEPLCSPQQSHTKTLFSCPKNAPCCAFTLSLFLFGAMLSKNGETKPGRATEGGPFLQDMGTVC